MIYGLYNSAAGMMTQEHRQDVFANNLANADTAGFKRDIAVAAERLRASQAGVREGPTNPLLESLSGGVWLGKTHTDFSEANLTRTEQSTDVALAGPGFLMVRKNGADLLTRDGRMLPDADGWLRAATDGAHVLGQGGEPLRVNPHGGAITIDEDGRVMQGGATVGRLALVNPRDYDALRKVGASRFAAGDMELDAAPARVMPGMIENSGVRPVQELVSMIAASRAYQLNAQMITLQDQSAGRLINAVAQA